MNAQEAKAARAQIERDFKCLGRELGMLGGCIASEFKTGVTFEDEARHVHHFDFLPILEDEERPSLCQDLLTNRL